MSNTALPAAIRRFGYYRKMTRHGFRSLAVSTIKEKLSYRYEVADRQLAHLPRSKVDTAYDRAKFFPQREQMMQDWADYTIGLKGRIALLIAHIINLLPLKSIAFA